MYYMPRIFEMTGLAKDIVLRRPSPSSDQPGLHHAGHFCSLISSGRKTLLIIGSFGMVLFLGPVAYAFYTGELWRLPSCYTWLVLSLFAFSCGAVIGCFISEIFPNKVRSQDRRWAVSHWIMAHYLPDILYFAESSAMGGGYAFTYLV